MYKYIFLTLIIISNALPSEPNAESGIGILSGLWIPTGDAKLLGVHPVAGVNLSFRKEKISLRLELQIRFLQSRDTYSVLFLGEDKNTRAFLGGFYGIFTEYDFLQYPSTSFSLLAGIGIDNINSCSINDNKYIMQDIGKSIGISYKYYFNNRFYIKPHLLYTFVYYPNPNGTSLKGNTVSLLLTLSSGHKPPEYFKSMNIK